MSHLQPYVLDTSAILCLYQDEPGAEIVQQVFTEQDSGTAEVFVSHMTLFELLYLVMSRKGSDEALAFLVKVRGLGMKEEWPDEDLLWDAARIKSTGGLSVADSFVVATAARLGAILVHKDPEFRRLSVEGHVQLMDLPG